MRTTEMVLFAHFLKTSKLIPACISIYIIFVVVTKIGEILVYLPWYTQTTIYPFIYLSTNLSIYLSSVGPGLKD